MSQFTFCCYNITRKAGKIIKKRGFCRLTVLEAVRDWAATLEEDLILRPYGGKLEEVELTQKWQTFGWQWIRLAL